MIADLILLLFTGAAVVNLLFWLMPFRRLSTWANKQKEEEKSGDVEEESLSIVVCARNEAENLKKLLPRILNQSYRSLELVLVDDQSTDQTAEIIESFRKYSPNFRLNYLFTSQKKHPGKKDVLEKGIEAAKGKLVLLTDADCIPVSKNWAAKMARLLEGEKEIGLGFAPYNKKPGLLNRFIRFETVYTALQYLSFAISGIPYMGVGRNLIYKKSLFKKTGGFEKHKSVTSGDDDLFVNEAANKKNVAISLSEDTFVYSNAPSNWREYYTQKSRHLTTGVKYKFKHQLLLGLLAGSHILFYMGGVVLVLKWMSAGIVIIIYLLRMLVMLLVMSGLLKKMKEPDLLRWIPLMDLLLPIYYLIFSTQILRRKPIKWKLQQTLVFL